VRWDRRAYLNDRSLDTEEWEWGGIITASGDVETVTSTSEDVNSGLDS